MHKLIIGLVVAALVIGGIIYFGGTNTAAEENGGQASMFTTISRKVKKLIPQMKLPEKKQVNPGRTEIAP